LLLLLLLLRFRDLSGATGCFGASLLVRYLEAAHIFAEGFDVDVSLASFTGGDLFSFVIGVDISRAIIRPNSSSATVPLHPSLTIASKVIHGL
jgi:hypothetical protein